MSRRGGTEDEAAVWGSAALDLERTLNKVRRGERIVSLFQTGPGQVVGDAGAIQLAEALDGCQHQPLNQGLVLFRLRGHQVGDEGAEQLASALEGFAGQKLHTLDLGGNRISDDGGVQLCKAVSLMGRLRKLDLSSNKLGDRVTQELAQVLPKELEQLQLAGNEIGALGVMAVAECVSKHPLKELILSENKVGNEGATHLAKAFGKDCGLVSLHLSWSDVADEGASALAECLPRQQQLRELWLTNNKIEDAGGLDLAAAMEAHGLLRLLALDRNKITDQGITCFVSALVRMCKKDLTCSLGHNISSRFDEDTLRNLSVAAATVRTICKRAMRLDMMLKFWQDSTSVGLVAQHSSTEEVVDVVILPESKRYGACYAEFFHSWSPESYVAHSWKGLFKDLLLAIAMHASGFTQPKLDPTHEQYGRRPEALMRRYFVDMFCIDQANRLPRMNPRCETDKVDFVIQELSRKEVKLVVAMDRDHTPMVRTWCLAEVYFAKKSHMQVLVSFGPIRSMPRRRKGMTWAESQASLEDDLHFLKQEILRGPGIGEKFEEEVIKPLQKQTLETYRAVYELMPVEQKEECDWMKAQDEAREDMKMFAENGNVEKLGEAINAGITVQIEESFMLPMRQRFAQLEVALTLNTEARFTVEEHILELKRTLLAAEEAGVEDADLFSRARQRLWEQEEEVRRQNERKALVALSQNGSDEERREARKILVFLEMADAVEARDLEALLRLVPEAEAAVVESHQEDEVAAGWRLIRELELLAAVKRRDLKEMRQRLDAARAVNVEEEKVLEASRKLALGEIKEGTKLQDAEMLLRALDEGRAAGLTENQLYTGKSAYLKMQAAAVAESTDMEDFRSVLAVAAEMGLPEHQDLAGTRRRLALLELREAADGTGISKLQQCIQSAKEHGVDKDDIDKGTFRLCVLELQQATVDFDSERLRDAMLEAKERAAPGELFPPAKRKLASIFPEAFTEWMLVELEETLAALDDDSSSGDLRAVLQEAAEAKVEEEDLKRAEERLAKLELREAATMSDLPEIERILNNAQVYGWDVSQGSAGAMYEAASVRRRELQAEERKVDCKQNLDLAVLTLDLNMMRQYIEEAKELGLDKEVIERAEAKYQEYA